MDSAFKFDVNISQRHLASLSKCVKAKDDAYVNWIIAQIVSKQFRDNRQTIVVMPKGLKTMPTPDIVIKSDFGSSTGNTTWRR